MRQLTLILALFGLIFGGFATSVSADPGPAPSPIPLPIPSFPPIPGEGPTPISGPVFVTPDWNEVPTARSKFFEDFTQEFDLAIFGQTQDSVQFITAEIANTAKPSLTPRWDRIDLYNQDSGATKIGTFNTLLSWATVTGIVTAGDYMVVTGRVTGDEFPSDGFQVFRLHDPEDNTVTPFNPKWVATMPTIGGPSNVEAQEITVASIDRDGKILIGYNRYTRNGHTLGQSLLKGYQISGPTLRETTYLVAFPLPIEGLTLLPETGDLIVAMSGTTGIELAYVIQPQGKIPRVVLR